MPEKAWRNTGTPDGECFEDPHLSEVVATVLAASLVFRGALIHRLPMKCVLGRRRPGYFGRAPAARADAESEDVRAAVRPDNALLDITVDFAGFDIEDVFVVGLGIDRNGPYSNPPYIAVLKSLESQTPAQS